MKIITTLFVGAAMVAGAGSAVAQERDGRGPMAEVTRDQAAAMADQRFQRLDADRDGRVTAQEMQQQRQVRRGERQGQIFDRLDTNRDGALSRQEFAARGQMLGAMRGQQAGRGGMRQNPQRAQRRVERLFGSDGVLTREEFRARALQRFERMDGNRDGRVTMAERRDSRQRLRQERMERRQQRD